MPVHMCASVCIKLLFDELSIEMWPGFSCIQGCSPAGYIDCNYAKTQICLCHRDFVTICTSSGKNLQIFFSTKEKAFSLGKNARFKNIGQAKFEFPTRISFIVVTQFFSPHILTSRSVCIVDSMVWLTGTLRYRDYGLHTTTFVFRHIFIYWFPWSPSIKIIVFILCFFFSFFFVCFRTQSSRLTSEASGREH